MHPIFALGFSLAMIIYLILQAMLHATQNKREPAMMKSNVPFFDTAIDMFRHRAKYWATLRSQCNFGIITLRMPFQRIYVVHAPDLIHALQNKAISANLVPNLLEFGMLFSGLNKSSRKILRKAFSTGGNSFTTSVHKYLLSGSSLQSATKAAVDLLSAALPNHIDENSQTGLLEMVRHELTLALTGAIYGPENPYDDPEIEANWGDFVPGINHLLYSPLPSLTARKALRARHHIISAFRKYFETDGHKQAFPMIQQMYELNLAHGLPPSEAAKMEMATSLAMLSSGAITTFWLLFHILSDTDALASIRAELTAAATVESTTLEDGSGRRTMALDLSTVKFHCPTLLAMFHETLRHHSTVLSIKQVQTDTTLSSYLLKKSSIVMIPSQSVHQNRQIWGPTASTFSHTRFLAPDSKKKVSSTASFRPFGAGASMCPGRMFSTNVILSFVAMVLLRYDVLPVGGEWVEPETRDADVWNAMPKPDWDLGVRVGRREEQVDWKFIWGRDGV